MTTDMEILKKAKTDTSLSSEDYSRLIQLAAIGVGFINSDKPSKEEAHEFPFSEKDCKGFVEYFYSINSVRFEPVCPNTRELMFSVDMASNDIIIYLEAVETNHMFVNGLTRYIFDVQSTLEIALLGAAASLKAGKGKPKWILYYTDFVIQAKDNDIHLESK